MIKTLLRHVAEVSTSKGDRPEKEIVAIASSGDLLLEYKPDPFSWVRFQIPLDSYKGGGWEGKVSVPPLPLLESLASIQDDYVLDVSPDNLQFSSPDGEKLVNLKVDKFRGGNHREEIQSHAIKLNQQDWLSLVDIAKAIGGENEVEFRVSGQHLTVVGVNSQFTKKAWLQCQVDGSEAIPHFGFQAIAVLEAEKISAILMRTVESAQVKIFDTKIEVWAFDAVNDICVEVCSKKFDAKDSPSLALDRIETTSDRRVTLRKWEAISALNLLLQSAGLMSPLDTPGLVEIEADASYVKFLSTGEDRVAKVKPTAAIKRRQDRILLPARILLEALLTCQSKVIRLQFGTLKGVVDGGNAFQALFSEVFPQTVLILEDWDTGSVTTLLPIVPKGTPASGAFCLQSLSFDDIMGRETMCPWEDRSDQIVQVARELADYLPMDRRIEMQDDLKLLQDIDPVDFESVQFILDRLEEGIVREVEMVQPFKQMSLRID